MQGIISPYELDYLKGNIAGGEGFDWFYASTADRDAQLRTSITDGSGKPWVFRIKDIKSWWQNAHFDRPGGVEGATSTGWVPESKPIWFTEIGCPAVDKGSNQPNVFVDPKSSESTLPYYSLGSRDDLIQRRYLQAVLQYYDVTHVDYSPGDNPVSSVYGTPMIATEHIYCYAWDARLYPAFPADISTWGDSGNWRLGHWLTGRAASAPLAQTLFAVLDEFKFSDYEVSELNGVMSGFVIDRIMSARDAIQPLELGYFLDSFESEGRIKFSHRGGLASRADLEIDDLADKGGKGELFNLNRRRKRNFRQVPRLHIFRMRETIANRLRNPDGLQGRAAGSPRRNCRLCLGTRRHRCLQTRGYMTPGRRERGASFPYRQADLH